MDEFLGISLVLYWTSFYTKFNQNGPLHIIETASRYFRNCVLLKVIMTPVLLKTGQACLDAIFKTVPIFKLHLESKLQQLHRLINHDTMVNRNRRGVTLHSGEPSKMWCQWLITALDLIFWCLAASRLPTPAQHHTVWRHVLTFCSSSQPSVGRALREHLPSYATTMWFSFALEVGCGAQVRQNCALDPRLPEMCLLYHFKLKQKR